MDRRLTPFSGRIGHISLQDRMADVPLTPGEPARVGAALAILRGKPGGAIDRQLIHGDAVTLIDRDGDAAFVMAEKDGYCGWLAMADLTAPRVTSHRVISPKTHLYPAPKVQAEPPFALFMNAQVTVIASGPDWVETPEGFIPARHLAPRSQHATDPVTVAESLLRTPYLWGCNSAAGVDCSGLVQLALHACGRACPGDSDQQQALGEEIDAAAPLQRGDLIFWKGHVALLSDPQTILHANGHSMDVCHEDLAAAIARIDTPVIARRRL